MTIAADRSLDFYHLDAMISPEERDVRDRVRAFCDEEVVPIINGYWERGEFPFELIPRLATLGLAGGTIQGYGCPGLSHMAVGVAAMELSRGDGSIETFLGVTSGLAMGSIYRLGSEEQKQRWLPAMARLEKIGAFGLTEPYVGSDAAHIRTTARRVGDTYLLNGAKRWIGNASFADVIVIWAQDEETGKVGGFLVEQGTPGYAATVIGGKIAKRALLNAEITLTNCEVPEANRLPLARSFRDTAQVLKATRFGVAWEGVGHAQAAFDIARAYALQREQFGRPIAAFQLVQQKLVQMLGELTAIQLLAWRVTRLLDEDASQVTEGMASLAKQTCAAKARQVVALGRELMGGNGILLENHMARHFADMEAVYTYEGTNEINALVVGREITGLQAFV
ncbi:acyl-CoA dehydrogenase family protein [Oscillochloris sp. ZM17-4]|uniref:acyl-CoA dehydrogenase family protein n=1 Tax=Oscillochloris sp. ZM17-4 TaxID=2866714 RepID=UPI001C735781|nr:acyl-CoA dehydrogenase family protein [Oscillochloris sp. ZM17-4]MBX0326518.1 acyl-CoA dehydrogenase family protein [Oscillochloris sp. ZM17-4]